MQQSLGMNKSGLFWTFIRWVWLFRNIIAIVGLLFAIGFLVFSETLEQRRFMIEQFSEAQQRVSAAEAVLKGAGDSAFQQPSKSGVSIPPEAVTAVGDAARSLRSILLSTPAPTASIQRTRTLYASRLADVLGAVNLYESDGERTIEVLRSLKALEGAAVAYSEAARAFQTSTWTSFWAAV